MSGPAAERTVEERLDAVEELAREITDLLKERTAADTEPAPSACECPCGWGDVPGHDWLLGLEERGLPGVVELIDRFGLSADLEGTDEEKVPVWDLPDLVARHSWQHPAQVHRLVSYIVVSERRRIGPAS